MPLIPLLLALQTPAHAGCEDVQVHPPDAAAIPTNLAAVFWRADLPCTIEEREMTVNGEAVDPPPGSPSRWFTLPDALDPGDRVTFTLFARDPDGERDGEEPLIDVAWTVSDEVIDRSNLELVVHDAELYFAHRGAHGTADVEVLDANPWDVVVFQGNSGGTVLDWAVPPAPATSFLLSGSDPERELSNTRVCPKLSLIAGTETQAFLGDDCPRPSRWACSSSPGPGAVGLALLGALGVLRRRRRQGVQTPEEQVSEVTPGNQVGAPGLRRS